MGYIAGVKKHLYQLGLTRGFLILPLLVTIGCGSVEPEIQRVGNMLTVNGVFRVQMEVKDMSMVSNAPKVIRKSFGLNAGSVRNGKFVVEGDQIRYFFTKSNGGPFIKVSGTRGKILFINSETPEQTLTLFHQLNDSTAIN